MCGALDYLSSETLTSNTRHSFSNEEIGIWSLNVLIHKFLVGTALFKGMLANLLPSVAENPVSRK
jgi:hypothetical protein